MATRKWPRICPKCGKPADRPRECYCRLCQNAYQRENRPAYAQLSERDKQKSRCRAYTNMLVKRGSLTKGSCEVCGGITNVEAHHLDYTKPRLVRWICRVCHRQTHEITLYPDEMGAPSCEQLDRLAALQEETKNQLREQRRRRQAPQAPVMTLGDVLQKWL